MLDLGWLVSPTKYGDSRGRFVRIEGKMWGRDLVMKIGFSYPVSPRVES
jgi:hypothetical protein